MFSLSTTTGYECFMYIPLSTAAIILNLKAIVVMLLSLFFLGDRLTLCKLILVLVSMIGTILIIDPGLVLYLISFLIPSVYQPGSKPAIPEGEPGMIYIFESCSAFFENSTDKQNILYLINIYSKIPPKRGRREN